MCSSVEDFACELEGHDVVALQVLWGGGFSKAYQVFDHFGPGQERGAMGKD